MTYAQDQMLAGFAAVLLIGTWLWYVCAGIGAWFKAMEIIYGKR